MIIQDRLEQEVMNRLIWEQKTPMSLLFKKETKILVSQMITKWEKYLIRQISTEWEISLL